MILNEIKEKLEDIDENVFYGAVDSSMKETLWNYIVFNRVKLSPNQNKTGYTAEYAVHIIREEYIPEGLEEEVIDALKEYWNCPVTIYREDPIVTIEDNYDNSKLINI
mgnify:CR=1 FL=1